MRSRLRKGAGGGPALLLILACGVPLSAQPKDVFPGEHWERVALPEAAGYTTAGLEKVRDYVKSLNTTGLQVVAAGRVLLDHGDLSQLSYLASVRKSILAMLYGNYVQQGKIDLKKTLRELEMTDHEGLLEIERLATVEHLITARSGIYHAASNAGDNSADAPPRGSRKPGSYFLYNNWDFNAAGGAFERITGVDIYDALDKDLARPIGMEDFDLARQKKSGDMKRSMYPAYHMWLSTRDMARAGYLMLREGNWAGRQVLPRQWARRIASVVTPLTRMNPAPLRSEHFGYGYMWWVWDGPSIRPEFRRAYTARGAYGQYITVLPALDMVVAHKTAVPPERFVSWEQYLGILERLIVARCGPVCL